MHLRGRCTYYLGYPLEKRRDTNIQLFGDHKQSGKANVCLSAFDFAHVATVNAAEVRESFLRQLLLRPQLANPSADFFLN
jgi:hypothetical protein